MRRIICVAILVMLVCSPVLAADSSYDDKIKPEQLGLPQGTKRTSEPFVTRIYKTDDSDTILPKQPEGYPFTIPEDYMLKDHERARTHQGVDFSSRPAPNAKPAPLDFNAGVHGIVVKAGDGPWGTITVQIYDGSLIQYLHTSASHVKSGMSWTRTQSSVSLGGREQALSISTFKPRTKTGMRFRRTWRSGSVRTNYCARRCPTKTSWISILICRHLSKRKSSTER
jgi:hypothetical protein